MLNERRCNSCNGKIIGRPDKKFCNDKCRSHYNYAAKMGLAGVSYRAVDDILKNNRELLKALYVDGRKTVNKDYLISNGFSFEFYTNIRVTGQNQLCFFCYDIGYSIINDLEVGLVK